MRAEPIAPEWHPGLPVFAKPEFLAAVGDKYGWLGGYDESRTLRCVLPYTIVRKAGLRLVRFRVQTIPIGDGFDIAAERSFLNSVVDYLRDRRADVIIPASNNAIFRTYPDGATAAPYGSYVIDLRRDEDVLWRNVGKITRQNIGSAKRDDMVVLEGFECLGAAYALMRETFRRSRLPFMALADFERFVRGLGAHGTLLRAEHRGVVHSYCLFGFSEACAYAIYAGNIERQHQGAIKLLQWEAMRRFRQLGVRQFDFVGARINPAKGSKQDAINQMKKRFGATLTEGYMWKMPLRPLRATVYSLAVRYLRGGDVVDQEKHKLGQPAAPDVAPAC